MQQIAKGLSEKVGIVSEKADGCITFPTQEPPNRARLMIMINKGDWLRLHAADRAETALGLCEGNEGVRR